MSEDRKLDNKDVVGTVRAHSGRDRCGSSVKLSAVAMRRERESAVGLLLCGVKKSKVKWERTTRRLPHEFDLDVVGFVGGQSGRGELL